MSYRKHLFVCITRRPPFAKPSCGLRDSPDLLDALSSAIEERGLATEIGVTGSQCLGPCESGPTVIIYPEGVWYQGVGVDDVAEIIDRHVLQDQPVERLLYRAPSDR